MHQPRLLSERSYRELLNQALTARAEGLVALRDREGVRHGIWVERGYVVGAHVAGRFDPLLCLLARSGALLPEALRRCLSALGQDDRRAGGLARTLGGVSPERIQEALQEQLVGRYLALLALAESDGHDAQLEPGCVPHQERSTRMPLGSLLRRAEARSSHAAGERERARKQLRELAREKHPDLHAASDPALRDALTRELAEATAAYHGLR